MHPDRHQTIGRGARWCLPDIDRAAHQVDDMVADRRAVAHRHNAFHPEDLRRWIFEKVEQGIGVDAAGAADRDGIGMDVVVVVLGLQIQKGELTSLVGCGGCVEE